MKVPRIDAGVATDSIMMYYNNTGATDAQDAANVWDTDYQGVWHMDESTTGSTDIGSGETGITEGSASATPDYSYFDEQNVANADGTITEVKINVNAMGDGNLRIITASRSGNDFTVRDFQNLTVTGTGVQTFSVDLDVAAGDFLGFWSSTVSVVRYTTASPDYVYQSTHCKKSD